MPIYLTLDWCKCAKPSNSVSVATWAVPCRPGTSPSCFGPQLVGPNKHEIESGRALPGLVSKNKAQHGPKIRRASVGPCWPKHGTYRPLHLGRRRAAASSAFSSFFSTASARF
jgi:hypothetical protein